MRNAGEPSPSTSTTKDLNICICVTHKFHKSFYICLKECILNKQMYKLPTPPVTLFWEYLLVGSALTKRMLRTNLSGLMACTGIFFNQNEGFKLKSPKKHRPLRPYYTKLNSYTFFPLLWCFFFLLLFLLLLLWCFLFLLFRSLCFFLQLLSAFNSFSKVFNIHPKQNTYTPPKFNSSPLNEISFWCKFGLFSGAIC